MFHRVGLSFQKGRPKITYMCWEVEIGYTNPAKRRGLEWWLTKGGTGGSRGQVYRLGTKQALVPPIPHPTRAQPCAPSAGPG
jgi:hypothetical protein